MPPVELVPGTPPDVFGADDSREATGGTEALMFELGQQRYAVSVADIVEIVRAVAVVALPDAPRVVLGVIDLRGELVPVLDLRFRFGLPGRPVRPDEHFVMLRVRGRTIGLRVDRAHGLRALREDEVQPITSVVPRARYVSGLAALPDGVLLIADAHAFLTEAESITLDEVLARPASLAPHPS